MLRLAVFCLEACFEKYPESVLPGELGLLLMNPMGLMLSVSLSREVRAGGVKRGEGEGAKSLSLWFTGNRPWMRAIHSDLIFLGTQVLS